MRKLGEDIRASEKRITATTRQLESMIRLSEARAKMRYNPSTVSINRRFSEEVEVSDVKEAARLICSATKEYATDPLTGKIDMMELIVRVEYVSWFCHCEGLHCVRRLCSERLTFL
jgi:DNA replication licensing factor MCM4